MLDLVVSEGTGYRGEKWPQPGRVYRLGAEQLLARMEGVGAVITDPPHYPAADEELDSLVDEWAEPLADAVCGALRPGGSSVMMFTHPSVAAAWEVATCRVGLTHGADITVLWDTPPRRRRLLSSCTLTIKWHIRSGLRRKWNQVQGEVDSNVLVCTPTPGYYHTVQRPVELMRFLVELFTEEGDVVVDPFCGSGSTLVGAEMAGRAWIGGDIQEGMCGVSRRRVQRLDLEEGDMGLLCLWKSSGLEVAAVRRFV